MKRALKGFIFCMVFTFTLAISCPPAMAQVGFGFPPDWVFPSFSNQSLQVPPWEDPFIGEGDILIDNFEYSDNPYNHGWREVEPAVPVYTFLPGSESIPARTVFDQVQGSRVLEYKKRYSSIRYSLFTPPSANDTDGAVGIDMATNDIISFDFKAFLDTEFQVNKGFMLSVIGEGYGEDVCVKFLSQDPPAGANFGVSNSDFTNGLSAVVTASDEDNDLKIDVFMGRGLLDGLWHTVRVDLGDAIATALEAGGLNPEAWGMEKATAIVLGGMTFYIDDIMFWVERIERPLSCPDMFEMGPLYAQLFKPYRYLFMADYQCADMMVHDDQGNVSTCRQITDIMLNPDHFITDPDVIEDYWLALGADSSLFGMEPDPVISAILGRDFTVDPALPIFADPDLQLGSNGPGDTAQRIIDSGTLGWNSTVAGCFIQGGGCFSQGWLQPFAIYPYDGMPTYIPAKYSIMEVVKTYGKSYYSPELVFMLEAALWNAGLRVWPNIASMDCTPQYYEDLIVTIEVTDGVYSDVRAFPISVVNYAVENYPPVLQLDIDDQIFYVGEVGEYLVNFIDPDCFIFSMSPSPPTSHIPAIDGEFRRDMDGMTWGLTINGLSKYTVGPWPPIPVNDQIIDPYSGLISWVPTFNGTYDMIISCTDARGGMAFGELTIYVEHKDTKWMNHAPVIRSGSIQPMVIKAGEELIMPPSQFQVKDPDGDQIYASCNIGNCTRISDDAFMWKFRSNFPGTYMVRIIFYDIRGGYATSEFQVDVKPWWSYD